MRRIILLLSFAGAFAQAAPSVPETPPATQTRRVTMDNLNKATEVLRNPGSAVDNASAALGNSLDKAIDKAASKVAPVLTESSISDPTQMTGSFTEALSRLGQKSATPGATAAQAPLLPVVFLSAKSMHAKGKAAIINAAGKNYLVREGGRVTFVDKNNLYEIKVEKINFHAVDITLYPPGRLMSLE